ncbi:hypothetical protein [Robertmurraya andreesenii]|uniref:Exosporium protein E n=1 Tax=Anoxybacillus andreesenii TaxID=1325932 RepID=A0ABT9V7B2_9BACL|nr:hypothetical protein [Robertmurraya andreesenii]MDQ0156846.1 hypothetical protein [Robertmurraya andreesenii]
MKEELQKRTWRVGTISMGISLLFLGVFLLFSQFTGVGLTKIMISWWPVILIVLGVEILLYLYLSRKEKPFIKYDFLSIFFVGIIGMVGIGFAVLSTTGLLDIIDTELSREERTVELPEYSAKIEDDIKRVVLKTEQNTILVEGTSSQEVAMFGTYTAFSGKNKQLVSKVEDYLSVHKKGDTLFLTVKRLPNESGVFNHYEGQLEATILIPARIKLEILGEGNPITLKPRELQNNWSVEDASDVSLSVEENSNVNILASQVQELNSQDGKWNVEEKHDPNSESSSYRNGTFKIGEGTHNINIVRAYQVSLSMMKQ